MKLKKCKPCKTYSLNQKCSSCEKTNSEAHYKFVKIKNGLKKDKEEY